MDEVADSQASGTPPATALASAAAPSTQADPHKEPANKEATQSAGSAEATLLATGRRKESIARVRLLPGSGTITINRRAYDDYFPREALRLAVRSPLLVTHQLGKYNVLVNVAGGGINGQAGAIRLGIARALAQVDPAHRTNLRAAGLLTRDPRMKERKKYGRKGARKRFQWTKR